MSILTGQSVVSTRQLWSAVGSMAMCAALQIASEFMPVSLLTPIASDMRASVGMADQAISISGLFAVVTSLVIPAVTSRLDRRRHVLAGLATFTSDTLMVDHASVIGRTRYIEGNWDMGYAGDAHRRDPLILDSPR